VHLYRPHKPFESDKVLELIEEAKKASECEKAKKKYRECKNCLLGDLKWFFKGHKQKQLLVSIHHPRANPTIFLFLALLCKNAVCSSIHKQWRRLKRRDIGGKSRRDEKLRAMV